MLYAAAGLEIVAPLLAREEAHAMAADCSPGARGAADELRLPLEPTLYATPFNQPEAEMQGQDLEVVVRQLLGQSADFTRQIRDMQRDLAGLVSQGTAGASQLESIGRHQECIEHLERLLDESSKNHARFEASILDRLEHLQMQVDESDKRHSNWEATHSLLAREKEARDAKHSSITERLLYLEDKIGEVADRHAQDVQVLHTRLVDDNKTRECDCLPTEEVVKPEPCDSLLTDRLETIERYLGCEESNGGEVSLKEQLDNLERHILDSRGHSVSLKEQLESVEKMAIDSRGHAVSLKEMLDNLEKMVVEGLEKHAVWEAAHSHLNREAVAREAHHLSLQERVEHLELGRLEYMDRIINELTEKLKRHEARHMAVESRIEDSDRLLREATEKQSKLEGKSELQCAALRDRLEAAEVMIQDSAEKHARWEPLHARHTKLQHEALQELLAGERRSREAHERAVNNHLIGEQRAREVSEELLQEQLNLEKSARERHHSFVEEMLAQERGARESHERVSREKTMGNVNERLSFLQQALESLSTVLRKEMEQRAQDVRLVWEAMRSQRIETVTQASPPSSTRAVSPVQRQQIGVMRPTQSVPQLPSAGSAWQMQGGKGVVPVLRSQPVSGRATPEPKSPIPTEANRNIQQVVVGRPNATPIGLAPPPRVLEHPLPCPAPSPSSVVPVVLEAWRRSEDPRGAACNVAFNALDRNHDGVITRTEWNQASA